MRGIPKQGLDVSPIESDGGITIKSASGVVLSVIDKGNGMLSVETYPYESGRQIRVSEIPAEFLRNPRTTVHVFEVVD